MCLYPFLIRLVIYWKGVYPMALGYLDIEYQYLDGPKKHAIHGMQCDAFIPDSMSFNEDAAIYWGAMQPINEDYDISTAPGPDEETLINATLIAALVRFHRGMHAVGTTVNAFRLFNGPTFLETPPLNHRVELNLPCTGAGVANLTPANQLNINLATGNVALLLDKSSATFGAEGGQMWLRYALAKSNVIIGDNDGVTLADGALVNVNAAMQAIFNGGSGLDLAQYCAVGGFGGGPGIDADNTAVAGSGASYVVINTTKLEGAGAPHLAAGSRYVSGFTFVGTLSVDDAQSRQYNRKGKRKVVTP